MTDDFLLNIGERIFEGRKLLKYTQEKTAELADTTKQTIQTSEKGQTELKASNVVGIAGALEMSADYLLTGNRTEYDLYLLDKRALGLSDRQYNYFKKVYLDFIELCGQGEFE